MTTALDHDQLTIRSLEHKLTDGSYVYDVVLVQDYKHMIMLKAYSAKDACLLIEGLEALLHRRTVETVRVLW